MIENEYVAILQHDTIKMRHPSKQNSIVTLYRIIATKSFFLEKFNKHIKKYDIGGYVESIENIDPTNPVWVDNTARIFDSAKILNGSYIRNVALVYENATVIGSEVADHCRVHGSSIIENSKILNLSEIRDGAKIQNSEIRKSSKISGNAQISDSIFNIAASAAGDCIVKNSTISDVSEIRGTAIVSNCKYSGRVVREADEWNNETIDKEIKLEIYEEVDESTHSEYKI